MNRTVNRTALAAILTLSLFAPFALAQAPAPQQPAEGQPMRHAHRPHDPHREAVHLSRKLGLTPDQTARLEPILAERQQKMMALRQNGTAATPDQMHEQRRAIAQATRQELAGVLSPKQLQSMHAMRRHGRRQGGAPGEQPSA